MCAKPIVLIAAQEGSELEGIRSILTSTFAIRTTEKSDPALWIGQDKPNVILTQAAEAVDEWLQTISACGLFYSVPVIVYLTQAQISADAKALSLGAADVILEPVSPEALCWRVQRAAERFGQLEKLKAEDVRLRAMVDSVPGGIICFAMDSHGTVTHYNDGMCAMLGYERSEFAAVSTGAISLVHQEDAALLKSQLVELSYSPRSVTFTFRAMHKHGHAIWVRMSCSPMKHENGSLHCYAVVLDVTREHENEVRLEEALRNARYASEHDALTGICNREAFVRKAERMIARTQDTRCQMVAMNIQRFKAVNELFGIEKGNELLRRIGMCLRKLFSGIGAYGRMEADHFAVCLPEKQLDMNKMVSEIDTTLRSILPDYFVLMDFGIYRAQASDVSVDKMYERASLALKTIKGSAVRRYVEYNEEMRNELLQQQAIEDEMEVALIGGQFVPYFQPLYTLEDTRLYGAEVLVRWMHPVKGMIAPATFIPLFERNGFITKMDTFIWERAVKQLSQWHREGLSLPISVNLSRVDVYQPYLVEQLIELVERYEVDPILLRLEITESAYTANPDALIPVLHRLREYGFSILMDDFGAGYSSLNALKDMPVDTLKIDMKFLHELEKSPRASSILASVVSMAKKLGMTVVAEGVETQTQIDFLRSVACECGQGYYFAKPMRACDYEDLLRGCHICVPGDDRAKQELRWWGMRNNRTP